MPEKEKDIVKERLTRALLIISVILALWLILWVFPCTTGEHMIIKTMLTKHPGQCAIIADAVDRDNRELNRVARDRLKSLGDRLDYRLDMTRHRLDTKIYMMNDDGLSP